MKHQPVLNINFAFNNESNQSKLDYTESNYIPVYSIGFPQYIPSITYDLPDRFKINQYLHNRMLLFYYNKNGRSSNFSEVMFKQLLTTHRAELKAIIKSEVDAWLNTPVRVNQRITSSYVYINSSNIATEFFSHNYFGSRGAFVYNYGFIGKYAYATKSITPQIVLMTKKENINIIKKCFILNQEFPKDIVELWVSPNLNTYSKNLLRGLKPNIIDNDWKVFKYDMQGVLAGIELPSFRSVKQKNEFEDNSWMEFCNKELGVLGASVQTADAIF